MTNYIYNRNTDNKGNHEVHTLSCSELPHPINRVNIGNFTSCKEAITHIKASSRKTNFDGCYYCCKECHTG